MNGQLYCPTGPNSLEKCKCNVFQKTSHKTFSLINSNCFGFIGSYFLPLRQFGHLYITIAKNCTFEHLICSGVYKAPCPGVGWSRPSQQLTPIEPSVSPQDVAARPAQLETSDATLGKQQLALLVVRASCFFFFPPFTYSPPFLRSDFPLLGITVKGYN